jgi:hypothetical protein
VVVIDVVGRANCDFIEVDGDTDVDSNGIASYSDKSSSSRGSPPVEGLVDDAWLEADMIR